MKKSTLRNTVIFSMLVLFCLSFFPSYIKAQNQPKGRNQASYTFVGTHFPMILEQDENGALFGIAIDIIEEISNQTGDSIEVLFLPWGRAVQMVKIGLADALVGPYMTESRKEFLVYTDIPFRNDDMIVITKAGKQIPWDGNLPSIIDRTTIAIRHWDYGDEFDTQKERMTINTANDLSQGLRMLLADRGEVLLANAQSALYEMKKLSSMDDVSFLTPPIGTVRNYVAFSKTKEDHDLQDRFNAALLNLQNSGRLSEIVSRHTLSKN